MLEALGLDAIGAADEGDRSDKLMVLHEGLNSARARANPDIFTGAGQDAARYGLVKRPGIPARQIESQSWGRYNPRGGDREGGSEDQQRSCDRHPGGPSSAYRRP